MSMHIVCPGDNKSRRGCDLHPEDQQYVLAAYVYRHTPEHPSCARIDMRPYGFTHASDADWLANTWFATRVGGRIDKRVLTCHSQPTWPFNPQFRKNVIETT